MFMPLMKLEQMDANYRDRFNGVDLKGMEIFSDLTAGMVTDKTREKIGAISEILVDDAGQLQYLVVDLGAFGSGRQVLMPIERVYISNENDCIYASGFSKEQAEQLPSVNSLQERVV
jgi:hypothetical protein